MQDPATFQLPFLLRDMLHFEYGSKFELVVSYRIFTLNDFNVVGATREGAFKFTVSPTISGATTILRFSIPDIPIWVSVVDANDQIRRGDTYVSVDLAINSDKIHALTSGYVYSTQPLTWPMVLLEKPEANKGRITGSNLVDPAAGIEVSTTVPQGEQWRIIAIVFTLVTSATVANRRVHVTMEIAGAPAIEAISGTDQTASLTRLYTCIPTSAGATLADDNDIIIPIPKDIIIPGGNVISTKTTNFQAGDNFNTPYVVYERFTEMIPI